ncbi:MAG: type VI secretion system ATPase TssH [Planctomycetes bacterium]|nr:type VI secretion system ATPase TssH [Planctomycetota bacterium]
MQVNLKSLVGKLNSTCRKTLEEAAGLCLSRSNYNVDVEHWLVKLVDVPNTDLAAAFRHFDIDVSRLTTDLTKALDRKKTGNADPPALSPNIVQLIREAWMIASVDFDAGLTRSGHLLCALLGDESLSRLACSLSPELEKISVDALRRDLPRIAANSKEQDTTMRPTRVTDHGVGPGAAAPTGTNALDQYTIDLTERARRGEIDPVLGRDAEIRQVIDILTRRRQNNPILTGEAGVGKTAVVEGFALRLAAGDVPPSLQNVSLRTLDLALLQAGAGIKGEFENRLKSVIEEVKAAPQPVILFIDEAHTMIGAGGQAGQGDAANILKPALARGELRTIAATTWAEYKKYFEKDAALARRFQVVKVEEPSEAAAIEMMRGLVDTLEAHHGVRILDEAVVEAVRLSHRYITGRQLPDKAISLLDTACARVALGHTATPPPIEDLRRRIEQLNVSLDILQREQAAGADHAQRIDELTAEKKQREEELAALEERWQEEKRLVEAIRDLRSRLEASVRSAREKGDGQAPRASDTAESEADDVGTSSPDVRTDQTATQAPVEESTAPQAAQVTQPPTAETAEGLSPEQQEELRSELESLTQQLAELQGESPLMQVCVDGQAVAEVVSAWTGIPVGRMVSDEIRTVLSLKERMAESIIGQDHALEAITQRIYTSRAKLADPRTPIGVFLLAGPSGVGKTETAITLANLLYGGEQNMTVINMSEFKEEHKVSLLMGSPPGYVGYGEGGVLTEAVRRKPYSVVLLDEMEKAHPGVQDIFYQVFDKGTMKDGEGRDIDFKNTLIIMTTNAGTELIRTLCADPETTPDPDALTTALHEELLKTFKPAFLGRLVIVPYYPLTDDVLKRIIRLKLDKVVQRVAENYRATLRYTPELVEGIAQRCTEVETGARNVDHILTRTLLPELAAEFLSCMAEGRHVSDVCVSLADDGAFRYELK